MKYDGRVAGIGASAGKEGDMGRSRQIGGGGGGRGIWLEFSWGGARKWLHALPSQAKRVNLMM
jgi:hypothetical protein